MGRNYLNHLQVDYIDTREQYPSPRAVDPITESQTKRAHVEKARRPQLIDKARRDKWFHDQQLQTQRWVKMIASLMQVENPLIPDLHPTQSQTSHSNATKVSETSATDSRVECKNNIRISNHEPHSHNLRSLLCPLRNLPDGETQASPFQVDCDRAKPWNDSLVYISQEQPQQACFALFTPTIDGWHNTKWMSLLNVEAAFDGGSQSCPKIPRSGEWIADFVGHLTTYKHRYSISH